jgi:Mrp family chromosome partitioning ATPase
MALDLDGTVMLPSPAAPAAPRSTLKLDRTQVLATLPPPVPAPPQQLPKRPPPSMPPIQAFGAARPATPAAPMNTMKTCSPTDDERLFMIGDPRGSQAAAFRLLRDTLVTKGLPRVLAVSSPAPEDGKTTCAINLALALAEQRPGKLLLIDCNFGAPAIASVLGVDETTADTSPERAWCAPFMLSAVTPCLHVATIAPHGEREHEAQCAGQPLPYVDFATLARLLQAFQRAGYQNIILDTPALEGSPEASLLVQLTGGVLLAVRSGRSTTVALRRAVEKIGKAKALGVTLMDSPD